MAAFSGILGRCGRQAGYLAVCALLAGAVLGGTPRASAQELPVLPDPVAVDLDASTTAYLVLDMVDAICGPRPSCVATAPAAASILAKARAAGALVVWTTGRGGGTPVAGLEQLPDDPTVAASADKFFNTDLDDILSSHGISTLVIVGVAANGAPMYTTFGASERGYTTVVAGDVLSADDPFAVFLAQYQVLNQPGFANESNTPLADGRPT